MPTTLDSAHVAALAELQGVRAELRSLAAAVEADVQGLRERVAVLERRRAPAPDGARLLSAIAATIGGSVFSAADLVTLAPRYPELAAAVAGASIRTLGLRLRRLARCPVAGYRLNRVKRVGAGQVWSVRVDSL